MTGEKTAVSLRLCDDYDTDAVDKAVRASVEDLGGIEKFIRKDQKVLIKPNMLMGKDVDKAVTTHPEVLRAVMGMVADVGAKMVVGDSPAVGSAKSVARKSGMLEVIDHFGAHVTTFKEACQADTLETCAYKIIELSREAIEADAIINLPKVKTHGAMSLTLGVKNMFGCIVGRAKMQWHFKTGRDEIAFARLLVDLYSILKPVLTVADGIIGMEGNGPGNGTPRKFGWIASSADAVAMDHVITDILQAPPDMIPTLEAARQAGVGETDLGRIAVLGDSIEAAQAAGGTDNRPIELPVEPMERSWKGKLLLKLFKRSLTPEPTIDDRACTRCGTCVNVCPPEVMSLIDMRRSDKAGNKNRVEIERSNCIHCFCCQELCPEGAITIKTGRLAWLLTRPAA